MNETTTLLPDLSIGKSVPCRPTRVDAGITAMADLHVRLAWVAFVLLGLLYVMLVRPGLPYDEPSHANIVEYYQRFWRMPVIGQPGVTYEGYHPPLYYVLAAGVRNVSLRFVSEINAFYLTRVATLLLSSALVPLAYLTTLGLGGTQGMARFAGWFVALNPSLLAISSSVQNDTLTWVLCGLAFHRAQHWTFDSALTYSRVAALAALASAALMSKSSAIPVVVFLGLWIGFSGSRRAGVRLALFGSILILCTGWWYLRNMRLYGDWSAAASVETLFASGHRFNPQSASGWFDAARSVVTYYTLPIEYFRNVYKTPSWIKISIVFLCLATANGVICMVISKRRRPETEVGSFRIAVFRAAACSGIAIGFWMMICARHYWVPARASMAALVPTVALLAVAARSLSRPVQGSRAASAVMASLMSLAVAANADCLVHAHLTAVGPYEIDFSQPSIAAVQAEAITDRGSVNARSGAISSSDDRCK